MILSICMTQPRTFYIKRYATFRYRGSSISILHTDSNFWNGSWLRRSEGFSALWSQDPYTLLSEFIFLDVFAPQCVWFASKRDGAVRHFEIQGNPLVILVDFLEMEVSLRASGRQHRSAWIIRTRDKHVGNRVRFERQRPSGVVQLLCESEDE